MLRKSDCHFLLFNEQSNSSKNASYNHGMSKSVAVIGSGPAGLIAAEVISGRGVSVDLYDSMPSLGRKFLMAGRGGLNITHSEPFEQFLSRYCAGDR